MRDLDSLYCRSFFGRRQWLLWRVPFVCGSIVDLLSPKSVIDLGCAIGDLVMGFHAYGVKADGVEGSAACLDFLVCPKDNVIIHDLRLPWERYGPQYDLGICFEVLEHIEEEHIDETIRTMRALSNRWLISAAMPGQRGHGHCNCQLPEYWEKQFAKIGFASNAEITIRLRDAWAPWKSQKGIKAYYQNLAFFEKRAINV